MHSPFEETKSCIKVRPWAGQYSKYIIHKGIKRFCFIVYLTCYSDTYMNVKMKKWDMLIK